MKKIISLVLCAAFIFCGCGYADEDIIHIAALKGPTAMGISELMQHDDTGYEYTIEATADAITPSLIKGDIDIAMVPCNLAAVLYAKTGGEIGIAAVNTLGVLYIVECGNEITAVSDLAGKTIYTTGRGTTPEYALRYVLSNNGIDPDKDVDIEFLSEAAEVSAALINNTAAVAVLPQPYVTAVTAQNENARVALSLTDEWNKIDPDSALITGVCVVRKDFAEAHPDELSLFLERYAASTEYVNEHPDEAAVWIEALEIGKAAIIEKAIPYCNIVCITGDEMISDVTGYLKALYEQDPDSVGGSVPDEDFFIETH